MEDCTHQHQTMDIDIRAEDCTHQSRSTAHSKETLRGQPNWRPTCPDGPAAAASAPPGRPA
eukprot:8762551-Lingulodinium_polyedra.AAC.1